MVAISIVHLFLQLFQRQKENEIVNMRIKDEILLLFPPPEKLDGEDNPQEQHQRLLAGEMLAS